jgi:hypothetical protein
MAIRRPAEELLITIYYQQHTKRQKGALPQKVKAVAPHDQAFGVFFPIREDTPPKPRRVLEVSFCEREY